jgi:hypothetical protein
MAKYMLARGQRRLPIEGIRTTPREGLPPLRQAETVVFEPHKIVETDLDFGPWVADGTLIRIREAGDPPRPPTAPPAPPAKPSLLVPLPIPAQVEVVHEIAPVAQAPLVAESHVTTRPVAPAVEAPKPEPVPEPEPVEEEPAPEVDSTKGKGKEPTVKVNKAQQRRRGR